MPLRRTLGVSLALLMISASANARTSGRHAAHHHRHLASAKTQAARHAGVWHRHRRHSARYIALSRHSASHARLHPIGRRRVGVASWYALDGMTTASGQRMNSNRLTAAHRTLPLMSYAKVTNLGNGRSIVVQINDRGPMSHRFIIDLSRRAATVLHMKRAGIARVAIQPVEVVPHQLVAINQDAASPGD